MAARKVSIPKLEIRSSERVGDKMKKKIKKSDPQKEKTPGNLSFHRYEQRLLALN